MNKSNDLNFMLIFDDLVEHAITVKDEQLSDVGIVLFRDHSSAPGKLPQ